MKFALPALTLGVIFDFIIVVCDALANFKLTPVMLAFMDETLPDPNARAGMFLLMLFAIAPLLYLANIVINRALIYQKGDMKLGDGEKTLIGFNSILIPICYVAIVPMLLTDSQPPMWLFIVSVLGAPALWGYLHWLTISKAPKRIDPASETLRRIAAFVMTFPFVVAVIVPLNAMLGNLHITRSQLFGADWWLGPLLVLLFSGLAMIVVYIPRKFLYRIMGINLSPERMALLFLTDFLVKVYGADLF